MPKKARLHELLVSSHRRVPPLLSSVNAPVTGSMAWAAQLHAVIQQHAWAAAVQTPGGAAGQFAAHQDLLVALRAQQAGAAGGGAAVASPAAAGSSANEASSFGPAVDQGHKSMVEMREERQVHPKVTCVTARSTPMCPRALQPH